MQILLDTSLLYALNDADDQNHAKAVDFLSSLTAGLLLPAPVLPELCYLLHSRLGHIAMRRFLAGLVSSDIALVTIETSDLLRITEILNQYADANLDFTDAAIITMAERLGLERIATFDHRDFSLVRPQHCAAFELLP
jgi:predicted nucleic acid-binding protein